MVNLGMRTTAIEALQEAAEMFLLQFFDDCNLVMIDAQRLTLVQPYFILTCNGRMRYNTCPTTTIWISINKFFSFLVAIYFTDLLRARRGR